MPTTYVSKDMELCKETLKLWFPRGSKVHVIVHRRTNNQALVSVLALDEHKNVVDVSGLVERVCGYRKGKFRGFWCTNTSQIDSYLAQKLYKDSKALTGTSV